MKLSSSSERRRLPAGVCGLTRGTALRQMLSEEKKKRKSHVHVLYT